MWGTKSYNRGVQEKGNNMNKKLMTSQQLVNALLDNMQLYPEKTIRRWGRDIVQMCADEWLPKEDSVDSIVKKEVERIKKKIQ